MADNGATHPMHDETLLRPTDLAAALAGGEPGAAATTLRIGKYQLKDPPIGRGGMGVVFEAVHDDLGHTVALKLMNARAASPAAQERFIREARVLANCHHPGIAQVHDAGTHRHGDTDIPYYVMEFVRGARTITRYAADKQLGVEQRLDLFARVCDAMQSVNDLNIIHRDLKPDNILVDATGQPKIIDFGVARVLNADLPLPAHQTGGDTLLGTLQYMSPEQTGSEAGHIDRRSDVYALGLVLYELLCGRPPYDVGKASGLDAAIRIIRELPPAKPSQVNPAVDDDIETILLKALHKDPDRRYQNAAEMAADLRHRLRDEPLQMEGFSAVRELRSRSRRLAARHRVTTVLGAFLVALLAVQLICRPLLSHSGIDGRVMRWMTGGIPLAGAAELNHVRMVIIPETPDVESIAARHGVPGVSTDNFQSVRRLHGLLLERLAESGARVVAFDIFFPAVSGFDDDFVAGLIGARQKGLDVVVGADTWELDSSREPAIAKTLLPYVRWGCVTAQVEPKRPWSLDLIFRRSKHVPLPSLALAAAAAYWRPGANPSFVLDWYTDVVYVNFPDQPNHKDIRIPLTAAETRRVDQLQHGILKGDTIGAYFVQVPSRRSLDNASYSYADVLAASPSQLRQWFAEKAIIVGDARPGRDKVVMQLNEEPVYGFEIHAAGLDALLSSGHVRTPKLVSVAGMQIHGVYLADFLTATAAAVLVGLSRGWKRSLYVAAVILVVVAGAITAYRYWRILYVPSTAVLAAVACSMVIAWVRRTGRRTV